MNQDSISNDNKRQRRFRRNVAILLIVVVSFLTLPTLCGSHSHDEHDHDHHHNENPSFKYSRHANENLPPVNQHHHHEHVHEHHEHKGHHHTTKRNSEPLGKFRNSPNLIFSLKVIVTSPLKCYLRDKVQETSMAGRELVKHSDKNTRRQHYLFSLNNCCIFSFIVYSRFYYNNRFELTS